MEEKLKHSGYMYMEEKPHLKISEMILQYALGINTSI